jgi:hemerythrin-like domain-containing protein
MNPSHVRTRIIQDHIALRELLNELEDAVVAMLVDASKLPAVRELARKLLFDLRRHTELEDAILVPALTDIDAWGKVRADLLLVHHQAQRVQIRELTDLYDLPLDPQAIARITRTFVNDLRADMQHEERDILAADLLRDDVVTLGTECG